MPLLAGSWGTFRRTSSQNKNMSKHSIISHTYLLLYTIYQWCIKINENIFLALQVTWIRRSDLKLLTIGKILYTQDQRFLPIHDDGSDVWILKLTNTQVKDSGEYECQVSYHEDVEKKLTMSISLKVLGKRLFKFC